MSQYFPKRYHTALVILHWLMAALLLIALVMGTFVLEATPNSSPEKVGHLKGHMIAGGVILVLTLIRLAVRFKTAHPAPSTTGNAMLDKLAPMAHGVLYLLVLIMAGRGIALSILAGLPAIVFGGVGALPADFHAYPPRLVHGAVAKVLMLVIAAHVLAALYHQFVRRDGLFKRMGFGPR